MDLGSGVLKFSTAQPLATTSYSSLPSSGQPADFYGDAVDSAGDIFFTENQDSSVASDIKTYEYVHGSGTPTLFADGPSGSYSVRNTIAVSPITGDVFVSDTYNNKVVEYGTDGSILKTFTTGLNSVSDIAVDGLGNLYAAEASTTIEKINIASAAATPLVTGLSNLTGLAVDNQSNLYYVSAENGGAISEVTAAGTPLGELFNTGVVDADFISVVVPEPSTPVAAATAVGLALLGRRRWISAT